ncbi:MAG: O-antigen ligase family protein [Candidatus Kapaibacterium sp.]
MGNLLIIIFFSSWVGIFHIFKVSTYGVTFLDLFTLAIYILFAGRLIWKAEVYKFTGNPAIAALIIFSILVLISGLNPLIFPIGGNQMQFMKTSLHFYFLIGFTLVCAVYPFEEKTWTRMIRLWLITALLLNIFGVYQVFARAYDLPFAWLDIVNASLSHRGEVSDTYRQLSISFKDFYRATSIYSEPSALAAFNVYIIALLVVPLIQKSKPFFESKLLLWIMIAFAVLAEFLALSMTGFIGLFGVLMVMLLIEKRFRLRQLLIFFAILASLLLAADIIAVRQFNVSVIDLFYSRISGIINTLMGDSQSQISGESLSGRLESLGIAYRMWIAYPVFGVGMGLTQYYNDAGRVFLENAAAVVLAELGTVGFMFFVAIFVILAYYSIRFVRMDKSGLSPETARLAGVIIYLLVNIILNNFITVNNLVTAGMWLPLGIVFGVINLVRRSQNVNLYAFRLTHQPYRNKFAKFINQYLTNNAEKLSK